MKINYKKITAIATSVLMTGMTVGTAMAAGISASDLGGQGNMAIVVGTGVSALDQTQAVNIDTALKTGTSTPGKVVVGTDNVNENEVVLGGAITASGSKIPTTIKNNKLKELVDDKLSWDDGTGSDTYKIHEELSIADGKMNVLTTQDDKKLEGVALSNEEALEYKLVFDDALNTSAVGTADADALYLSILGKDYEVTNMDATSIDVTTSSEVSMAIGQVFTMANGKTVTLTDVYSGSVEVMVDGKSDVVNEGTTKKINGVRVRISSLGYHDNAPETSKAILKIGEDITKSYKSGDEYIGQNKDDPLWVWDISDLGSANGYIGVKYNAKINSANDEIAGDSIKYVGDGYALPDNYAAVTLDSVTDAKYQDLKVYFESSDDLFNASDGSTAIFENKPVLVIEGKNTDSITVGSIQTSKIFLYLNNTAGHSAFQTYYLDTEGDYTPTNKMRLANASIAEIDSNNNVAEATFATIAIGDTDLIATIKESAQRAQLAIKNVDDSNAAIINVTIGGTAINETLGAGTLEYMGTTKEDATTGDILFHGTDVSTEDYSYMDHYGVSIAKGSTVKSDVDNDEATLSVPEEQVYAQVSVSMGATVSGTAGNMIFKDSEASSYAGKNVVIVGGSCVNSAAAAALGVAANTCGEAFTAATNVGAGQFLIKKTTLNGKTAIVVAGYEADDTGKAAQYLINKGAIEGVYTTATQEKVVTA